MKTIRCLLLLLPLLLGPTLAFAQDAPAPEDLIAPESKAACVAQCEQVYADCKTQCENVKAEADVRHFEIPDQPVPDCIADCKTDLSFCKEDC